MTSLAPPSDLASAGAHPGSGVGALALSLAALLVLAGLAQRAPELSRDEPARPGRYRELARSLLELEPAARVPVRWTAGLLGLYTVSLSLLELF